MIYESRSETNLVTINDVRERKVTQEKRNNERSKKKIRKPQKSEKKNFRNVLMIRKRWNCEIIWIFNKGFGY